MTFRQSPRMICATLVVISSCLAAAAGCGVDPDDPVDEVTQAVGTCSGNGPGLYDMVCGIGVSSDGFLAVKFRNVWWSVDFFNGYWDVQNNVTATPLDITPTTWGTDETPPCTCGPCDPNSGSGYPACQEACRHACENIPKITSSHMKYTATVSGLTYNIEAVETTRDKRARA